MPTSTPLGVRLQSRPNYVSWNPIILPILWLWQLLVIFAVAYATIALAIIGVALGSSKTWAEIVKWLPIFLGNPLLFGLLVYEVYLFGNIYHESQLSVPVYLWLNVVKLVLVTTLLEFYGSPRYDGWDFAWWWGMSLLGWMWIGIIEGPFVLATLYACWIRRKEMVEVGEEARPLLGN